MAAPLKQDELTRVAAYLAQQRSEAEGRKPPRRIFKNTSEGVETAELGDNQWVTLGRRPDSERGALQGEGYEWMAGDDYARTLSQHSQPPLTIPNRGQLPFISNTPTHEAPPNYSSALPPQDDPGMTSAMSKAATAWRQHGAQQAVAPTAPPATAKQGGNAKARRSLEVSSTTQSGPQPQLREFQPLAQLAPKDLEQRLGGLPEGVAREMRKRWGLEEAQGDANRRALAVELASAANQVGSGIAGGRYDDSLWDNQRSAARQPVADYEARAGEERIQNEEQRRAAEDEREARAAERAAQMEMERFQYGKTRDMSQDQLARDRMAQEAELARQRLLSEGLDRGLRREEMRYRQKEGEELKRQMAEEKAAERQRREGEKDLQRLGEQTSKAPYGELQQALEEVDRLVPGLAYGNAPDEAPMGFGDRVARSVPLGMGNWAVSDEGQKYGTVIANLRDLVSRFRSGAVLNEGEERHYLSLLGDEVFSDPRRAAAGINAVRQGLGQRLRNVQGAYAKTGALDEYESTGATTYRAPIFSGTGRRVPVVDPNGRAATIDESELAEALKDGWRRR